MDKNNEYRLEVKVKNNLIYKKIIDLGYLSPYDFCKKTKFSYSWLCDLINLKISPLSDDGQFAHQVDKLADLLNCLPENLFTSNQLYTCLETNSFVREIDEAEMQFALENNYNQLSLEKLVDEPIKNKAIEDILDTLTPREKKIIQMRFGLGEYSKTHTLQECSEIFYCSRDRIRQIEAKALRKLRHPSRSESLIEFIE
jgi:RNA polymerase sigma factor (sigma-70 family)